MEHPGPMDVLSDLAALDHCASGLDLKAPGVARLRAAVLFNVECARFAVARTFGRARDACDGGGGRRGVVSPAATLPELDAKDLADGLAEVPTAFAARVILLRAAMRLSSNPRPSRGVAKWLVSALCDAVTAHVDGDDMHSSAPSLWLATVFALDESTQEREGHRRLLLARCCHAMGEFEQSWEHLALIPIHTVAARLAATIRADLCLRRGSPDMALETVLEALQSETTSDMRAALLNLAGCCHEKLCNHSAAVACFCAAMHEHTSRALYTVAAYNCAAVRPIVTNSEEASTAVATARQSAVAELHAVEALADALECCGVSFLAVHSPLVASPLFFNADTSIEPVSILPAPPHLHAVRLVLLMDPEAAGDAVVDAALEEAEALLLRRAALLALRCGDWAHAEAVLSRFFLAAEERWVHTAPEATRVDAELLRQCAATKLLLNKPKECSTICMHLKDTGCIDGEVCLIMAAAACQEGEWAIAFAALNEARATGVGVRLSPAVSCWIAIARARCALNGHGSAADAVARLRAAAVRRPTDATCMQHFCHLLRHCGGDAALDEAAVNWHAFCSGCSDNNGEGEGRGALDDTLSIALVLQVPFAAPEGFDSAEMTQWTALRMKTLRPAQVAMLAVGDVLAR